MKYSTACELRFLAPDVRLVARNLRLLMPVLVLTLIGAIPAGAEDNFRRSSNRHARGTYQPPTVPASQAGGPTPRVAAIAAPQPATQSPAIVGPVPVEVIPVPQGEEIYLDHEGYGAPGMPYVEGGPYGEVYDASCDALPGGMPGCGLEGGSWTEPGCGLENCGGCDLCSTTGCIPLPRLCADQWFGSAEWLLWYRRGQDFPVLAATPAGTAAGTPLFGGKRIGESDESGLRLTIGHWLDDAQCQSLLVRLWALEDEDVSFGVTGADGLTVVRPFLDVSASPATAGEYVAVRPGTQDFLNIGFQSELSGGDAALRQLWVRGLGGRIDLVYGYQYLRLDENLSISSRTAGPADSIQMITDEFDVENEFHGAQLGLAIHYDERCWSFDALAKLGFGSLQRRGALSGTTVNRIGAAESTEDQGLLVRSTNSGVTADGTFAVAPEVSVGLGYQLNRSMNITFGYSFLMITDALQTWQTLDDSLAVNLDDPPLNPARPSRSFSYNDYWVQGLQFGVNYNF